MSTEMIIIIVALAGMVILMLAGVELAWAMGIMAVSVFVFVIGLPINQIAWSMWDAANCYTLTALPLFVFMGAIFANTGTAESLYNGFEKLFDRLPGSLACATFGAAGVFAAMSGSSTAGVATLTKIALPSMEKRGYSPMLALGSIVTGGNLAPLIPPSMLLIIYGTWQGVSIVDLFAAALIPGVILVTILILTTIIRVKLNPSLAPSPSRYSLMEKIKGLGGILPFVLVVFGVLGSLFAGIMTPTESAAMGGFLSLVLSLAYRRLTFTTLKQSLYDCVRVTSFCLFLYAMAIGLTYSLNMLGISTQVARFILDLGLGESGTLALFLIMYTIMGMFFEPWSMLFLTFPFVMPIIAGLNINFIWWGVIYVLVGEVANATPPVGFSLFVLNSMIPRYQIETIAKASLNFIPASYLVMLLLVFVPELALWLPSII